MTEPKKRGRPFKKGNDHGKGRPPYSPEEKGMTKLTKTEILRLINLYLTTTVSELKAICKDDSFPAMQRMITAVALSAIEQGDHKRLDFFFDRLIGKVTDKVEHTLPRPTIIQLSDTEQIVLGCEKVPEG